MGILFTIMMGFLFTITMGIQFTIVLGIQFTISNLKLTFAAERSPPPQVSFQEYLMAAEASIEYFS